MRRNLRESAIRRSPVVRAFSAAHGCGDPTIAIERRAGEIVNSLGTRVPPFQTERFEYARLLGIRVVERESGPDGKLSGYADRYLISIRKDRPPERRSFAVCHELGHAEMVRAARKLNGVTRLCALDVAGRDEERLASVFAANLLMPGDVFRSHAKQLNPGIESLVTLSQMFLTSLHATALRVQELGLWSCVAFWGRLEAYLNGTYGVPVERCVSAVPEATNPFCRLRYADWALPLIQRAYRQHERVADTVTFRNPFQGQSAWQIEVVPRRSAQGRKFFAMAIPLQVST